MKIRNGFVSNSSSSSFIIAVPKTVETVDDLQKYLMGDQFGYPNPYICDKNSSYCWPASLVAGIVFEDMNQLGYRNICQMIDEYSSGYTRAYEQAEIDTRKKFGLGQYEFPGRETEFYIEQEKLCEEYSGKIVEDFVAENQDCLFYIVSYADDTELGSAMEHGALFDYIPHLRVSHH